VAEPTTGTGLQETADAGASGDDTIVVTGSRIQRRDLTSPSPIAVVAAEEFQLTGAINVEQVINTLPQAVPGTTGFSNNPGSGAATLNLRNLGATRTLVLVNGRRWMSYDTNQIVDLNTIPQFMLQNVEVLTGGQSATYGSDAIAGVVNFNLRQDLNGAIIGGQYALTEQGDGARYDVNFAVGSKFADGRGSVTVYANYTRREPIFQDARAFSRNAAGDGCIVPGSTNSATGIGSNLGGALATCVSRGGEVGLVPQGSASTPIATLPGITTGGASLGYVFNPTGGGTRAFNDPADLYNFAPDNYLMLPQERYLLGGYGSYEIAENITGYTEVSFVKSSVPQELAPTPIGQALNLRSPAHGSTTRRAACCVRSTPMATAMSRPTSISASTSRVRATSMPAAPRSACWAASGATSRRICASTYITCMRGPKTNSSSRAISRAAVSPMPPKPRSSTAPCVAAAPPHGPRAANRSTSSGSASPIRRRSATSRSIRPTSNGRT